MQSQTLKSITISGITVSETAEGTAVRLSIKKQSSTIPREDFRKLVDAADEFFTRETVLTCGVCGQEMTGVYKLTEKTAVVSVEPCQTCARKEPLT